MTEQHDVVVRGLTDEQAFRVITAITTNTNQEIITRQQAQGRTAELLSDLVTGTMMIRETMAPDLRVQGILRASDGRSSMVADSWPDGTNRGLLTRKDPSERVVLSEGAMLQMMRTLPNGSIHQGVVQLSSGDTISDAFMKYMHDSEQIKTNIAVGSIVVNDRVVVSGGYFVQLLPELSNETLATMIQVLEKMPPIKSLLERDDTTAKSLMEKVLERIPYQYTSESPIRFGCNCNHERILGGLATLERSELQSLIDDGEPLSITCDYCGKEYQISITDLEAITSQS